jgi:hypothetical protein
VVTDLFARCRTPRCRTCSTRCSRAACGTTSARRSSATSDDATAGIVREYAAVPNAVPELHITTWAARWAGYPTTRRRSAPAPPRYILKRAWPAAPERETPRLPRPYRRLRPAGAPTRLPGARSGGPMWNFTGEACGRTGSAPLLPERPTYDRARPPFKNAIRPGPTSPSQPEHQHLSNLSFLV